MDYIRAEGLVRLALVTQKITRSLASDADLTVNELHCVMQLHLEKPCCVRQLTEILGIGATSTSKLLRSLAKKGWISRSPDEDDRRVERIALTPAGNEIIQRVIQAADGAAHILIGQLPPHRREPFTECIYTVTRHISTFPNTN